MTVLRIKISIFTAKISEDLFLVIAQVFRIFPFFPQIFRVFTVLNVIYDPHMSFSSKEKPLFQKRLPLGHFFTLFVLSRASDNTTSQNIGGTDAWAVPTSNFWGDRPPSPPRSPPLVWSEKKKMWSFKK